MSTIDLSASAESLALLADAVTRPLPSRPRGRSRRHLCCVCDRTFFRSRLSPHRCPHCHSDVLVEITDQKGAHGA